MRHEHADVVASVTIWYPKEGNFRIEPHTPANEDTFWYFELGRNTSIAVGRHAEDLDDEIVAMRKLAELADEAAGLLEQKAARLDRQAVGA